ncbi:FAD-dependent oxidoreductase [Phanerochaete sordida]|uniref:FAD-dependent oxidoreductase n=1 Tax=Phanerochaete sordida TaxID=48140 RepID=A0A9P3G532_9APHY|nr:FAD-dependent oxidoreductase [Phanerochaete sordida]
MGAQSGLQIAILGGGVCGLTCAVALAKKGINARIYEAKGKLGEIGAGIGIGCNALSIMRELGAYDDILAATAEPGRANLRGFRFVYGAEGHDELFAREIPPEECGAAIHRAALLQALVKHTDPAYIHFNKRAIDVTTAEGKSERSIITFDDGTTAEADVVLIANGVKSSLRRVVTGLPTEDTLSFSNTVCYRGLVTKEQAAARGVDTSLWTSPSNCCGNGKHIIIYPISHGAVINIAAFVARYDVPVGDASIARDPEQPTVEVVSNEEMMEQYSDFGSNIRAVLGCIDKPNKWYISVVYPHLKTYVRGKVALIGDAAHGMLPHLYAGAGQGIEDGWLLAQLLSHPGTSPQNVEEVLKVYDELRRPRSQKIWDQTLNAGKMQDGHGPSGLTPEGVEKDGGYGLDYVNTYRLGEDVRDAVKLLNARGVFHA